MSLSKLVAEQPQYFIEKGKIECPDEKKEIVLRKSTSKLRAKTSAL